MNYCSECGHALSLRVPRDDDRARHVCDHCGLVHYQNPRIVVCAVPAWEDKVLLCKRAIEPRHGLWTLPGGFMENGETTQAAALRETREEACASIEVLDLYTLYSLPYIDQVHMFYRANLLDLDFAPGRESLEVALFTAAELPWQELAFAAVASTLRLYFRDLATGQFPLRLADVVLDTDNRRHIRPFNFSHEE
jgi:ADP-ribose pyrophosphatase YjhB (NUDIX family)